MEQFEVVEPDPEPNPTTLTLQFEVVDELASAIQLADQYCYSNTFIYTQPGNGARSMGTPPPTERSMLPPLPTPHNL